VSQMLGERSGWITFAGIAALVAGVYNSVGGLAALGDDDTLAAQATEVLFGIDLTAWSWFWLVVGVIQLVTGVLILRRHMWGLWLGVIGATLSMMLTPSSCSPFRSGASLSSRSISSFCTAS
jgi:hypothetical protein